MSEWIKVSERLPDEGQTVCIFYHGEICYGYRYRRNYAEKKGNDFFEPVRAGYSCVREATHWMIIEPPK
jgi:hypothetical protein